MPNIIFVLWSLFLPLGPGWADEGELSDKTSLDAVFSNSAAAGAGQALPQVPVIAPGLNTGVSESMFSSAGKVIYNPMDWMVGQTPHFAIHFSPDEEEAAAYAAAWAEEDYARIERILGQKYEKPLPMFLYPSWEHFSQTNLMSGSIPEGVGGFTDEKSRVAVPFTGSLRNDRQVFAHELTHQAQFETVGAMNSLPLWATEGLAEYASQDGLSPTTVMLAGLAAREGFLPSIEELNDVADIRAYILGHALWQFIADNYGEEKIAEIWGKVQGREESSDDSAKPKKSFSLFDGGKSSKYLSMNEAIKEVLGKDIHRLSREWALTLKRASFGAVDKQAPWEIAQALTFSPEDGTLFNGAPALSPDGKTVVFLSAGRDLTLGLYAGDVDAMIQIGGDKKKARKEKPVKLLAQPERSETLEALRFLDESMSWSPRGDEIAYAGFSLGHPVLYIMNVASRKITQTIRLNDLDAVRHPSWSPDGGLLVFSANKGGFSDLYLVGRDGAGLTRLTNDPYGNLQPAWSPDGRTIAFVTDQDPEAAAASLALTDPKIVLYDVDSGSIRFLTGQIGKNLFPQWSPDGARLAFVSDRTGVLNLFIQEVSGGGALQVTDLIGGILGASRNGESPALAWSRDSGRLAFSVLDERMNQNIFLLEDPLGGNMLVSRDQASGLPRVSLLMKGRQSPPPKAAPAALPEDFSLVKGTFEKVSPYKAKVKPEFFAFGAGIMPDNGSVGVSLGGIANFSDLAGNHKVSLIYLGSVTPVEEALRGGLIASYANQKHRVHWGGSAFQLAQPYLYSFENPLFFPWVGITSPLYRGIEAFASYPLSRFHRVGLSAQAVAPIADEGGFFSEDPYYVANASYVRDNTLWSSFGPWQGTRAAVEAGQAVGSKEFTRTVVDVRQYIAIKTAATVALRAAFADIFGRDPQAIFIGGPSTVRGYSYGEMGGNMVALGNAEVRVPLFPVIIPPLFAVEPYGNVFGDVGYTHAAPELENELEQWDITTGELKAAAGLGFRVPISWLFVGLDWAWPILDPDAGGVATQFSLNGIF
ncbi:MAG: PD40 domain-containing protein [Elusimicrobia bacterium]|nr:PD40 domain-containing protein [Elusimicrobiota bacterium]